MDVPEPVFSRLLEARDVLAFSFDFELLEPPLDAEAYTTPSPWLPAFTIPDGHAAVVGRDAMGGVYVLCDFAPRGTAYCLHLDPGGHFALLGETLQEAVALLVALPHWRELLNQCPASLDAMRALAVDLEREVFDDLPALPEARDYLQGFLGFPSMADPLARLYELNQQSDSVTVLNPHGWRYETFGA